MVVRLKVFWGLCDGQVKNHTGISVPNHVKGMPGVSAAQLGGLPGVSVAQVWGLLGVSVLVRVGVWCNFC